MKTLKFAEPLVELVLKGEKNVTWRINDEKNIDVGDDLQLLRKKDLTEFAKAAVIWVKSTTLGEITSEDMDGHEGFNSKDDMYKTYSGFYGMEVGPTTKVKVIKFRLV